MSRNTLRSSLLMLGLAASGYASAQSVPASCNSTPGPLYCYNYLTSGGALCQDAYHSCCTPADQIKANHPECFSTAAPTTPTVPTTGGTASPTPVATPVAYGGCFGGIVTTPVSSSGVVVGTAVTSPILTAPETTTPLTTPPATGGTTEPARVIYCSSATMDPAVAYRSIVGTSIQQASAIGNAVSARLLAMGDEGPVKTSALQGAGMAAGGVKSPFNAWANVANNDSKYNRGLDFDKSSNDVSNTVFGFDYRLSPTMVVGLSAAIDRGDGALGAAAIGMTTKGYAVAPYFGVQLTRNLALDASVGYGEGKFSAASDHADSDRSFYALNLTYAQWFDNLQLTGKGSFISAIEKYGDTRRNGVTLADSSSKNKLDQVRIGAQLGYWMDGLMPYLAIAYSDDTRRATRINADSPWDTSAWVSTIGVNFFSLKSGVSGGIAYSQESGRSHSKNKNLMANINIRF